DFHRGSSLLLFSLCLVWAADTGAFIAGKAFGKHKLAPHVSPKKTWEGVAGGALLAILVAIVSSHLLSIPDKQLPGLALMVVIIVSYSVIGDLTESIFKRLAGVKDSGNILPGHGGVLDRIDGLTAVMPLCLLGYAILGIN
ncbi:MAG: phosphatidate cytidylyltransferase, partial [Gammaproteobacteria bacterium]|nr:phosphatidate cytidylyltransferase [Gammaproteobacteria bacterium]